MSCAHLLTGNGKNIKQRQGEMKMNLVEHLDFASWAALGLGSGLESRVAQGLKVMGLRIRCRGFATAIHCTGPVPLHSPRCGAFFQGLRVLMRCFASLTRVDGCCVSGLGLRLSSCEPVLLFNADLEAFRGKGVSWRAVAW